MSVTKKELRDELALRLQAGKPSGDFEISNGQIDRVLDLVRDRVVADYLFSVGKYDGFFVPPEYVAIEKALPLTVVATTDEVEFKCTLANPILSTPLNDYGVVRVRVKIAASPYTHTTCRKVDRRTLQDLKRMEFTLPSAPYPVVYREGQDLYFSGLELLSETASGDATKAKNVTVEYVEAMVGGTTDYSISEAHVGEVTEKAEEILRRELSLNPIIDEVNDGSVNPPAQPQQTRTRR